MTIMHLIKSGSILADTLVDKASEYPVKSTAHEKFSWEAVGIRHRVDALVNGENDARQNLRYKDTKWGAGLYKYSADLAESVAAFYKEFYEE